MSGHRNFFVLTVLSLLIITGSSTHAAESWEIMSTGVSNDLYALWGIADDDILAAGENGIILYYNGGDTWDQYASGTPQTLYALWGDVSGTVIAAGSGGAIVSLGYTSFSSMESPTILRIQGLWGMGSGVFGVGQNGVIIVFNGSIWQSMDSPTGFILMGIWGSSTDDIFAVGELGTIIHFDGDTWEEMTGVPTIQTLNGIWGASASDIFIAGDEGTILHYDGAAWESMETPTTLDLECIWGSAGDDVFASGYTGVVLHYDGYSWEEINMDPSADVDIHAVWGSYSGRVYFSGDSGIVMLYERDDTIQPEVIASDPEHGETGVSTSTEVRFLFPEEMSSGTLSSSTVILTSGSLSIPGTVSYSGRIATFTPTEALDFSTQYTASVSTAAEDSAGNGLKQAFSCTFTTEASPGSGGSSGGGCFVQTSRL